MSSFSSPPTPADVAAQAMVERVVVFVDYQNVQRTAHDTYLPVGAEAHDGQVDPMKLAKLLVARRRRTSRLIGVRVYRGRPNPTHQPGAAAANDRQAAAWTRAGIDVSRRPLTYPYDWPKTPAREKGVDVALACDVIHLAASGKMDAGIIVSRDTDLLPAFELVREMQWAHLEAASWDGNSRLRMPGGLWCHLLSEQDFQAVRDDQDYRS